MLILYMPSYFILLYPVMQ